MSMIRDGSATGNCEVGTPSTLVSRHLERSPKLATVFQMVKNFYC